MAKCLEMLCTTGGSQTVAWNPLALSYISHIGGGEFPTSVVVSTLQI